MSMLMILSYLKMNQNFFDFPRFNPNAFLCIFSSFCAKGMDVHSPPSSTLCWSKEPYLHKEIKQLHCSGEPEGILSKLKHSRHSLPWMVCFSHSWLALKHVSSYLVSKLNYKISICCLAVWWSGTSFLQGNWINLCNLNEHWSCIFFFFPPWWFWESRWTQSPSAVAVLSRNVSVGMLPCVCLEFHSGLKESLSSRSKMKGCCEAGPGRGFSSYCRWPFRAMWPLVLGLLSS